MSVLSILILRSAARASRRMKAHVSGHVPERCGRPTHSAVIARLDQAIQYSRDGSAQAEKPRRTGCPGQAEASQRNVWEQPLNPPQLSHYATLSAFSLSFGTTLERIAAESLTPPDFRIRSRNMSRDSLRTRTRSSLGGTNKRRSR